MQGGRNNQAMFEEDSQDGDEQTAFKPSRWKWLQLAGHRMVSSKQGEEEEEFEEMVKAMKLVRTDLSNIHGAMKYYLLCTEKLAKATRELAAVVETDARIVEKVEETMAPLLVDRKFYDVIGKKIKLMDNLLGKDVEKLKFIRITRERAQKKLAGVNNKNGERADKEKRYLRAIEDTTREYDELLTHMMRAMSTQVKIKEEQGVTALIKREMQQFKLNQFQLFLNFQRLITGRGDKSATDLELMWNNFAEEVASSLENTEEGQGDDTMQRGAFASMLLTKQEGDARYTESKEEELMYGSTSSGDDDDSSSYEDGSSGSSEDGAESYYS